MLMPTSVSIQPWLAILLFLLLAAWTNNGDAEAQAQSPPCASGTIVPSCTYLPVVSGVNSQGATSTPTADRESSPTSVPTSSTPTPATFSAIPVEGLPTDRIPSQHGDLNLSLRGYTQTTERLTLVDNNGGADADAPQIAGMFAEPRLPEFSGVYQVHDWDWGCEQNGCRTAPLTSPPVTLLEMVVSEGEAIHIPSRNPEIYGGGYKALVLYAEAERATLTYLREDTVANGYAVHIENVQVDSGLLSLYRTLNDAGRGELPALKNGEQLGNAIGTTVRVAIRDRGTFMDPRSRKDWWQGYR